MDNNQLVIEELFINEEETANNSNKEEAPKKIKIPYEDKKFIRKICTNYKLSYDDKLEALVNGLDVTEEEALKLVEELGMVLKHTQYYEATLHLLAKKKRYIISSAQASSPVNIKFLKNIEAYAKFIDAEIGIIATRYKNPTSIWKEEGDVWDDAVQCYLTAAHQDLHKNLTLLAALKVQATSPNPTTGIEPFGKSCIVGSPRIEMRTVPVLPGQEQIFLYSTGSVTVPNFTDTVAGGKAEIHHSYGFTIVEIENEDVVHIRSVSANDEGEFNDLIYRVSNEKVSTEEVDCLVWGDSHFAKKDSRVTNAFRDLCFDLGIKVSVLHDVWDSESINVHNLKDPIIQYRLMQEGRNSLDREFKEMKKELSWFEEYMEETIIVASNHDDMLDRALVKSEWKDNLTNAEIFLKCLKLKLAGKASEGIVPYTINKRFKNIIALGINDTYTLHGVELGLHGHKGPNGSKGSLFTFAKLPFKTIIGHSHSPAIKWGCYQVGLSCKMDHEYNTGLTGWAYAGVTLNRHGKRQMIVFNQNSLNYTTLY